MDNCFPLGLSTTVSTFVLTFLTTTKTSIGSYHSISLLTGVGTIRGHSVRRSQRVRPARSKLIAVCAERNAVCV